jgi:hypothetical protein
MARKGSSWTVLLLLLAGLAALTLPRRSQANAGKSELAVRVINQSQPVLCAEKDNVSIMFQSPQVRHFSIEAAHPNYINMLQRDSWEADWTDCDMSGDRAVPAQPRKVTIYSSPELSLIGIAAPSFWRKNEVPVRVGDRVEHGLHLIQLWIARPSGAYEVMVMYPPDGYWRARPLPPPQLASAVYGSSFMVGPVEQDSGRPVVNLKELAFDPATRSFQLQFADASSATLKLRSLDENRIVLDVDLSQPVTGKRPFAGLRSMYVTEYNADAARIAVREPSAKGWREENVMTFGGVAQASDIWVGRLVPSRHNTSAPDIVFRRFGP